MTTPTPAEINQEIMKTDRAEWWATARSEFKFSGSILAVLIGSLLMVHFLSLRGSPTLSGAAMATAVAVAVWLLMAGAFAWLMAGSWPTLRSLKADPDFYGMRVTCTNICLMLDRVKQRKA